ncbi:MAG: hypothetical protein IPP48_04555 [Chitinophagaceae bacterium]|nr:hypothetical protein [Chitinophagaceae bacterium]
MLKLPLFLHPQIPQPQQIDGFLYKGLLLWLTPIAKELPFIYSIITFILLYAQAITLNKLANDQKLFAKPNYLTGMSYLLITSLFTEWQVLSAPLIISTIIIWVLSKMSNLYNTQNAKTDLFNIGLVIGIGTFFYFPSVAFLLLVLFGLALIRPFKLAEWVIALLGVITPYYFLLAYVFIADKWQGYTFPGFAITRPFFNQTNLAYIAIGLVLGASAFGLLFVNQNFRRQLIQSRKSWNLIFLYLLIAIFIPFINATHTFNYWVLCAVPFAVLIAATFFYTNKKWISLSLHWIMVGLVIALEYFFKK